MYVLSVLTAMLLTMAPPCINCNHINVSTQDDFDNLSKAINRELARGARYIKVRLAPGTFFYNDNHIDLSGKKYPDASISIEGKETTLIAKGKIMQKGDASSTEYHPEHGYVSLTGNNVELWSKPMIAYGLVEVVSEKDKLCRLKSDQYEDDEIPKGMYIQVTQWYLSRVYPIVGIKKGYIYFTATNLSKGYHGRWNVNNDYYYGKKNPRYRVFGKDIKNELFYECAATQFLALGYVTELKNVDVKGIRFCGNARDGEKSVLACLSPCCEVRILDCEFIGIRSSRVISIGNKNKVMVKNCHFVSCYEYGIVASHSSEKTRVEKCSFNNMGLGWVNSFCVSCAGKNYYVANNSFQDFGYGAIAIGNWYGNEKTNEISGIVEKNTISFTLGYRSHLSLFGLMDSGAIYFSTQNDKSVVRYNIIDGYVGAYDNHGVFCDDGAFGFEIYGNVITNIGNGRCIASRRDASIESERNPQSKVWKANVNNVVRDNIMDGDYLFCGNEQPNNGCVKGRNYLIKKNGEVPRFDGGNFDQVSDDVLIQSLGTSNGKLYVPKKTYNILLKSLEGKYLKTMVKR